MICRAFADYDQCTKGCAISATTVMGFATALIAALGHGTHSSSSTMALVSIGALLQGVASMPVTVRHHNLLLLFLALPLFAIITHTGLIGTVLAHAEAEPSIHPVQQMVDHGRAEFAKMVKSQSQSLDDAVAQYSRRYHRMPPPHFDKWFEIAQNQGYVLVDEFDSIMETLEPFWGLKPEAIRNGVAAVSSGSHILSFTIRDHSLTFSNDGWAHWFASVIQPWIDKPEWMALLPDMDFAMNVFDEPRVVAPNEVIAEAMRASTSHLTNPMESLLLLPDQLRGEVTWINPDRRHAWDAMGVSCPQNAPALKDEVTSTRDVHLPLPHFIDNLTESQDVCTHADYKNINGFLEAPESLSITHSLLPIFSQGKPSTFQDILSPSPYYSARLGDYNERDDPDWDDKKDTVYWTGASTGGHSYIDNWRNLHRQRLSLMTEAGSNVPVTLMKQNKHNRWEPYGTTWSEVSNLTHIKIMAVGAQCEPDACTAMREHWGLVPIPDPNHDPQKDPQSASYGSKYVLDMDGNGFSGRFYRTLISKCAVLKQTIMKEWHDGRLVPWVHFIPVSLEAKELGELMRFLLKEKEGPVIGKQIAEDGRNWARTILREADFEITFLRILMEYGRIVSDDRDTLYYTMEGS